MFWFLLLCHAVTAMATSYDWNRLHACISPDQLKETVFDYVENFPCLDCKEHFTELVRTHPFPLQFVRTTEDARVWTWLTHNLVNMRLNKTWESFDIMLECKENTIKTL